jgi:GxxExxY protein
MALDQSRDPRTFAIIGAAMEVHRVLGSGYLELFFRDALRIEFGLRSIPFESEVPCVITYKGRQLRGIYRIDFVCFQAVIVEVKARSTVGPAEHAQMLNYLAATGLSTGLLLNFSGSRLEYRRFVHSPLGAHAHHSKPTCGRAARKVIHSPLEK